MFGHIYDCMDFPSIFLVECRYVCLGDWVWNELEIRETN